MRTPARLCQLFGVVVASVLVVGCAASDAGPGASGSGGSGAGTGGTTGTGGAGSGGAIGSGGSGSGGGVATGGSDGGAIDMSMTPDVGMSDGAVDGQRAPVIRSMGCGQPADQALAMYVRKTIMSGGRTRYYDLYLPTGYDPMRAYPLLFMSHGCDGSIPFRIERVTKGDAIIVAPRSASSQGTGGGCFDTGPGSASLTEVAYFDIMKADVEAKTCVDKAREFHSGHSSGSWLSNLLGCARAGVTTGPAGGLRGQGNTAGGMPVLPACTGPIAAILAHDMKDDQNAFHLGELARDRILKVNGCGTETVPWDYDGDPATPSPCVAYQGCMPGFPVVWCPTNGKGHSDQVGAPFPNLSTIGFWRFWSQF